MSRCHLGMSELIDGIQNIVDTIWVITLESGSVQILKDSMTPELEGGELSYAELYDNYVRDYVYPADLTRWEAVLSLQSFRKMASDGNTKKTFDMRFRNEFLGFEWHEAYLTLLYDEDGIPDRLLLTSRNVNQYRKTGIIERAVETEYDYVVYIEPDKNSYVMYSANHETGTPVPPVASDDYAFEVAEFHRRYVPEEERESLTERLSIGYVQSILQHTGEFVTYCKVLESGVYRDKKLRFSYFDRVKNIWLLTRTDITAIREERRQKELLRNALTAATVANRAKSEFLSRMSHDIRTPMNAIIGMTAIAGAHIDNTERVWDCLSKITDSSKLLLSLINEVLDMAKVESGSIALSEEEIDLAELVQSVVGMVQPEIDTKSLDFNVRVKNVRNEKVIGDTQRLQQVLLNLLSNAIKYTPEGGHILLEVGEKPSGQKGTGCFEFIIEDDGIGMKPEFLKKLFDPFERADDPAIRTIQGTGLGMSISKNIVELMDGNIRVESIYGKGSKFTVMVFLRLQEQAAPEEELFHNLPILVVDDDELVCKNTCHRLSELGMDSQWTRSGKEAVEITAEAHETGNDFFAIIIDLRMPGMDGIETTRRIRARVGYEVPIIMISAYDWSEYEDEARQAGVNGFIMKPLFRSRLVCQLRHFIRNEPVLPSASASMLVQGNYMGKRVLLVEDNELNREIAYEFLSSTGMAVENAENGKVAVDKVAASQEGYYDLIFMDMQMPVMDGCEAARTIRRLKRKDVETLPIIAMTANAFADDIMKTREAGMNEHIAKPVDLNTLSRVLDRWLNQYRQIRS